MYSVNQISTENSTTVPFIPSFDPPKVNIQNNQILTFQEGTTKVIEPNKNSPFFKKKEKKTTATTDSTKTQASPNESSSLKATDAMSSKVQHLKRARNETAAKTESTKKQALTEQSNVSSSNGSKLTGLNDQQQIIWQIIPTFSPQVVAWLKSNFLSEKPVYWDTHKRIFIKFMTETCEQAMIQKSKTHRVEVIDTSRLKIDKNGSTVSELLKNMDTAITTRLKKGTVVSIIEQTPTKIINTKGTLNEDLVFQEFIFINTIGQVATKSLYYMHSNRNNHDQRVDLTADSPRTHLNDSVSSNNSSASSSSSISQPVSTIQAIEAISKCGKKIPFFSKDVIAWLKGYLSRGQFVHGPDCNGCKNSCGLFEGFKDDDCEIAQISVGGLVKEFKSAKLRPISSEFSIEQQLLYDIPGVSLVKLKKGSYLYFETGKGNRSVREFGKILNDLSLQESIRVYTKDGSAEFKNPLTSRLFYAVSKF